MSMYPIASIVTTGSQASVQFNSIPQNFTHLQARVWFKSNFSGTAFLYLTVGPFSGSPNYNGHILYGDGSSVTSSQQANNISSIPLNYLSVGSTPNIWGSAIIDILDYTNTNKYKTIKSIGGFDANGSGRVSLASGFRNDTLSAITDLNFFDGYGTLPSGFRVDLYGITTA